LIILTKTLTTPKGAVGFCLSWAKGDGMSRKKIDG
jgi:hypothetical protein